MSQLLANISKPKRNKVELVDNAGGHNITPELIKKLTYVEVFFLPPNTTSFNLVIKESFAHSLTLFLTAGNMQVKKRKNCYIYLMID